MVKAKAKILVVDDDPNLRKTLADILRIKGYDTAAAATGAEAIAEVERGAFSLALIDLMLPDMQGIEVMARIKAISPLTEAIILTGHASMDTAIEATRQGAYSYLLKPYQMDDLLRNIRHGVERQQAQEEILRLASFPRLHPSPVIELDSAGAVTYANPAAEKLFPDLGEMGMSHPLLNGLTGPIPDLRSGRLDEICYEAEVGEATYELHIYDVRDAGLIRIYVTDITQRKRNETEIHLLATTDSLTGISNRSEFSRMLASEMDRAKRYGTPLSLIMYDLDYFKRVNDSFGHDAGDEVLRAVTDVVKGNTRAVDVVARWGGEEFMVLMPQSDLTSAKSAAEKLRQAIAEHRFDKVNTITVSFGVTEFVPQDDFNTLLKRVDDALYLAKANGRNRVETLTAEAAAGI
ncbi:MAG: diguanylate cyclase [Gammaproteobacteria bacterium]|nr:diguanylate cyclase [Gammaproteobacteria bacterium]MBU1409173.1 diguanylate cyclase [Gammaproteobacteria bacterium]MBU1531069.1 diguanylate cyclase [Gammaproteobacteria bacterium]